MNQEAVIRQFNSLPPEAQREAADFISFLESRYKAATAKVMKNKATRLSDEAFFGMWSDRQDMEDSSAWVRKLRKEEWERTDE